MGKKLISELVLILFDNGPFDLASFGINLITFDIEILHGISEPNFLLIFQTVFSKLDILVPFIDLIVIFKVLNEILVDLDHRFFVDACSILLVVGQEFFKALKSRFSIC